MTFRDFADLLKAAAAGWVDDYAQSMGAALAFYTLFSIAPLLLIVISIAGFVFGKQAAHGEIFAQLQGTLGASGALAVQSLLESAHRPSESIPATVAGILFLWIAATSVFAELQDALNRIWNAPAAAGGLGLWRLVRNRLLSFVMILGIGLLLMVSLVLSAGMTALGRWWNPMFHGWDTVAYSIDLSVSYVLSTIVFAMIYKTMPRVRVDWKDVWIGAAFTAFLVVAGKFLIGVYLGRTSIASGFGAAASLVVLLLWVYYSAQVFLFGAEFTWAYSHKFGSRKGQKLPPHTAAAPLAQNVSGV